MISREGMFYLITFLIAVPVASVAVYVDRWFMRLGGREEEERQRQQQIALARLKGEE